VQLKVVPALSVTSLVSVYVSKGIGVVDVVVGAVGLTPAT